MARRDEEIKVGALIVVAVVVFLIALVFVGGVNLFRKPMVRYTTYFKFAGGVEPGNFVRFGGLKVGTVESADIDPGDSTRIRVRLHVARGTPIRTNSRARISTLGFLGENYIEVSPGTREAPMLQPGNEIPALEIVQLADVFNNVNNVTVNANKLVNDLDDQFLILANNANRLIADLNAVVGPETRRHLSSALSNTDAMLAESRPRLRSALANIDAASARLAPMVVNADKAITQVHTLAGNLDAVVIENRKELHEALVGLQESLADARGLIAAVDDALQTNRPNLDETLENLRATTQNLKQFTDTIKRRPFSLIRVKAEKDRVPPVGK